VTSDKAKLFGREADYDIDNDNGVIHVNVNPPLTVQNGGPDDQHTYTVRGNVPSLDGRTGAITAIDPAPDAAAHPAPGLPHWWTDDPAPETAEGVHHGAGTVSRWRRDFLADFAARLERARTPAATR